MKDLTPEEQLTKRLRFKQAEVLTNKVVWGAVDPLDLNVYENMMELSGAIESVMIRDKCPQLDRKSSQQLS